MIPPHDPLDGAILVDKPAGPTSHDIVAQIRRTFRLKKVGHAGTLDPAATGLLIVLLGKGTKLSEKLMSGDKIYEGELKLGQTTDTYDADGEVTSQAEVPALDLDALQNVASSFVGDLLQVPPMHSAIKKEGVPLYKLARQGVEVERAPRLVHIYQFKITAFASPLLNFKVACTKGTYIRSLAHDLGQKLGCGAHLTALRRTHSGDFDIKEALPIESILQLSELELQKRVVPFLTLSSM